MVTGRFHIIIDVSGVEKEILNDEQGLKDFLVKLVKDIDMEVLYGPVVVSGIPENPGLSGFVIIDYSHISIHTFTANDEALVDIFSCKPYSQDKATEATLKYFKISKSNAKIQEVNWG